MEFIIDRNKLTGAVVDVLKAVSQRTTIPILTGIKIKTDEEGITLTGSDSNVSIERFIPVKEDDIQTIEIKKHGSIVLQAHFFSEIIKKLPSDQVEITVDERFSTKITSGKSEFNIHGLDAEEYPRLPQINIQNSFQVKALLIKNMIRQTAFAVSVSETRPILTGVNWKAENGKLTCVATDSHRLAMRELSIEKQTNDVTFSNVVIPGKALNELAKILADDEEEIEIVVTDNQILFKAKHLLFYSRLLEGKYPDTTKLIPTDGTTTVVLPTKSFLQAIERASLLSREGHNNVVKLTTLDSGILEISSNSPEIGKVFEQIPVETTTGEDLNISFSAKYMIDALRTMDSTNISIDFTGTMRPFLIHDTRDRSLLQLILPVRTY